MGFVQGLEETLPSTLFRFKALWGFSVTDSFSPKYLDFFKSQFAEGSL